MTGRFVEFTNEPTAKVRHGGAPRIRVQRMCEGCGRSYWTVPSTNKRFCSKVCSCPVQPLIDHPTDPSAMIVVCTGGQHCVIDRDDADLVSWSNWAYRTTGRRGKRYVISTRSRRPIHGYILKVADGMDIDHSDLDTLNNRRSNLREATRSQNCANKRVRCDSLTGFKGVTFKRKRGVYEAYINKDGKRTHLGTFRDATEAARAYDRAAVNAYGEFARLNFSDYIGRDAA